MRKKIKLCEKKIEVTSFERKENQVQNSHMHKR